MSTLQTTPAVDLNKISMFKDDGVRQVEQHLPLLAKLFVDYKMEQSYAIGYLHRHFDIPKSSIWVHERNGQADNVVPKPINSVKMSSLEAHSYCLQDGKFKVFEYQSINDGTSRQPLTPGFLIALKEVLQRNNLEDVVSLCPREQEVMFETLLNNEGGTTASPVSIKPIGDGMTTETAQWCFDAPTNATSMVESKLFTAADAGTAGVPGVKSQRECCINRDGFHFVNDNIKTGSAGTITSATIADAPGIKSQRECWINRDGFHFVNDNIKTGSAGTVTSATVADAPGIKSQRECWINRDGFHFVNDAVKTETDVHVSNAIQDVPGIKSQRECWINRDGFHFVNDSAGASATTQSSASDAADLPGLKPIIKSQRECWINRDGFHFVNDQI